MGLHCVIEELHEKCPDLHQLCFLDDSIFKGSGPLVRRGFSLLRSCCARIGLDLNLNKCEIYGTAEAVPGLEDIPVITDRDGCTYLGGALRANGGLYGKHFPPSNTSDNGDRGA